MLSALSASFEWWGLYFDTVCVASMITSVFFLMMPFVIARETVFSISRSSMFPSRRRWRRNTDNEDGSIGISSGVMSRKYLKAKSVLTRLTKSLSERPVCTFRNRYLNMVIGLIALRPLSGQYLSFNSSYTNEKSTRSLIRRNISSTGISMS